MTADKAARQVGKPTITREQLDTLIAAAGGAREIADIYPVSPLQHGLLFHSLYAPDSAMYVVTVGWRLTGELNVEAFANAWSHLVERHALFRTAFLGQELEVPLQVVRRQVTLPFEYQDWRDVPAALQQSHFEELQRSERQRGFDFARPPLMRIALVRTHDSEHLMLWSHHHALLDGWSLQILRNELLVSYLALCRGQSPQLAPIRPYRDYIAWLQQQDLGKAEAYWRDRLQGFTRRTQLEVNRPPDGGTVVSERSAAYGHIMQIPPALLESFARTHKLTVNALLLGAWSLLLSRYCNSNDVVFGVTIGGRPTQLLDAEKRVGLFVNTLPLRAQIKPQTTILHLLQELQARQHELIEYQYTSLVDIQRWSDLPAGTPLFDTAFVFQNYPLQPSNGKGSDLPIRMEALTSIEQSNYSLVVQTGVRQSLMVNVLFDALQHEAGTIERLVGHFEKLLEGILSNPERPCAELSLLDVAERDRVLIEWNATRTNYPGDRYLHQLFSEQAARTPQATALMFEDRQLSYAELDLRSSRLAHHLRSLGVGPDVIVGLCIERSIEMMIALLGILKSGGAYLPLDPQYPVERLTFMLEDAQPPIVLTRTALESKLPSHWARVVCLDADDERLATWPTAAPDADLEPGNLAYVIYTSGSTGRPKGVMVQHRGLTNYLDHANGTYQVSSAASVPVNTALSFDATVTSLWTPLLQGRTVILLPEGADELPALSIGLSTAEGYALVKLTPAHLGAIQQLGGASIAESEHVLVIGGEALSAAQVAPWRASALHCRLINEYGPTETVVGCCVYEIDDSTSAEGAIPIGRPICNTQLYVLDAQLDPLPIGVTGELFIGGMGLARGYLNRPALTAERFIAHPFAPGERLYRTGDLVRYRADGNLEFIGRRDEQVKLNGYRIELGEVEAALLACASVAQAIVLIREDRPNEKRLVGYVVSTDPDLDTAALRAQLGLHLPNYMTPSVIVLLETMPLTKNGKVDRKSLPAPEARVNGGVYIVPRTLTEAELVSIWCDVLHVDQVGIEDNFFELGGHSLIATRVVARCREMFEVEVPLRAIFETPTIREIAAQIDALNRVRRGLALPQLVKHARPERLPLSYAQERLWFLEQMGLVRSAYNIPLSSTLEGVLDVPALELSLAELVRRHESLRTRFEIGDGGPTQVIDPPQPFALTITDVTSLDHAEIARLIQDEAEREFDLSADQPVRVSLLRLADERHILLLTLHHIISDGWSQGILTRELNALYEAFAAGRPSPLAELAIQYVDYALWQRSWLHGEVLDAQVRYWKQQLAGAPPSLELPTDRTRPAVASFKGGLVFFALSDELSKGLQRVALREGATLYMVSLAAFQVLLGCWSGQKDILVGSPIAGRMHRETEGLIGFFVNTLVMRSDLSRNPTFRELLRQIKDTTLSAYAHQDIPFEKLVEQLDPIRDLSRQPIFQVALTFMNVPRDSRDLPSLRFEGAGGDHVTAKFDLMLFLSDTPSGLHGAFEYATDLFDRGTIERLVEHFEILLGGIVADPDRRIASLPLLSEAERQRAVVEWNATQADYPRQRCIYEMFSEQAARTPDATALVFEDQPLTYAQLDRRANQLARHLQSLGVGPDVIVALCVERSFEMVIGILGILKAGGAYLPLDPKYPRERLAFTLEDAQAPVIVTQSALLTCLPESRAACVCVDTEQARISEYSETAPASAAEPENIAYVIYTSGSTGRPKGVILHHSAVALLAWSRGEYSAEDLRCVVAGTSLCFDLSIFEIFAPLSVGGTVLIAASSTDLPVAASEATLINSVPSAVSELLRMRAIAPTVRVINVAGEPLHRDLVDELYRRTQVQKVYNLYGPSESTTYSTYALIESQSERSPSIGRAISNTTLYVLDESLEPVPIGVVGELYIGGAGLARGYLNRPGLTAQRFIAHPFTDGERVYRTGDLVRYRNDGNLEFIGRRDEQVKLRGYRIELGEIESALLRHAAVSQAVIVAREDVPGDKRLVGYVVADREGLKRQSTRQHGELQQDAVQQWSRLFEDTYEGAGGARAPSFSGWMSSYSGEPIAESQMQEWLNATVQRIEQLGPQRVLEIGCGVGLLVQHLAPGRAQYRGTDISAAAIGGLRSWVAQREDLRHVELACKEALAFDDLPPRGFDTVILNSVIQYFPDIDYLLKVIEEAAQRVSSGGRIFLGDIRHLELLSSFHAATQLAKASPGMNVGQLRRQIARAQRQEKELLIDPAFFAALIGHIERISAVEILLKRGVSENELTRYRYDVVLHVENDARGVSTDNEQPWRDGEDSLEQLQHQLQAERPTALRLTGIANRRLARDLAARQLIESSDAQCVVEELQSRLESIVPGGEDPEQLWALGEGAGYEVRVSWAAADPQYFDVEYLPAGPLKEWANTAQHALASQVRQPWGCYASEPLFGVLMQELEGRLREHLKHIVPDYMVPSAIVVLESLPLTMNGKVDRKALPVPGGRSDIGMLIEPRNSTEERLSKIWREVLHLSELGVEDNFFELGGHSLIATRVVARVRDEFEVELALRTLFEAPTISGLASHIEALRRERLARVLPPLVKQERPQRLPLSHAQERLWFLEQLGLVGSAYNMPMALQLAGPLDLSALTLSLGELTRRHENLRTRFESRDGEAVQVIDSPHTFELAVLDLTALDREARQAEATRLIQLEAEHRFDLAAGPLFRFSVLKLADERHMLLMTLHHIVSDGWSQGVLLRELSTLYAAFAAGHPSSLAELPIQYADYALWQRSWLHGEVLDSQVQYWKRQLEGAPPNLDLPTDRPRPAVASFKGESLQLSVNSSLLKGLQQIALREGATLYMVLLAAFQVLLSRWSGQKDIVVGSPIAGRTHRETEGLIGFFVNTLVMRIDLSRDPTFREVVRQVKETTLGAYAHQDIPFERLVAELQPDRDLSRQAVFQVAFALQNVPQGTLALPDLTLQAVEGGQTTSKVDMTLLMFETSRGLLGRLEYATDLFDRQTVERFAQHFETLLTGIVAEADRRVTAIPVLGESERHRVLVEWNASRADHPHEHCVHESFAQQVARTPDAVAVEFADRQLTYGELERRSNQLAHHLQSLGVGPDVVVGLCVERSADMVIGLLAILKAGGAYLPLDPQHPLQRLTALLDDARARVVVTHEAVRTLVSKAGSTVSSTVVCFDTDRELIDTCPASAPPPSVTRGNLAYVIYTSGSTGRPKGVLVQHEAIERSISARLEYYRHTLDDLGDARQAAMLLVVSCAFDSSIAAILWTLLSGGRLVLPNSQDGNDPRYLRAKVRSAGVTHWLSTSSLYQALLEVAPEHLGLRCAIVGGETLSPETVALHAARCRPGCELHHEYGPSEATIWSTVSRADLQESASISTAKVAIGRAISNTTLYVLDDSLEPVPMGVVGELYIGGAGLARGYLNRAGLTAERFIAHPFAGGERVYRTGDRVRYRNVGNLEFIGRRDDQVKLRGYRIELGEIESALLAQGGLSQAVVVAREDVPGEKRLVGYVVADRERLKQQQSAQQCGELRQDTVQQWSRLFEDTYESAGGAQAPSFSGWMSSYSGEPIAEPQMQEWLKATVQRIEQLGPQRVLEIGCGVGLLVQHLAPGRAQYRGTDISAAAIEGLRRWSAQREELRHVELDCREAQVFDGLAFGGFDTVILNSVIQYFPDIDYLLNVIEGAVQRVSSGGRIFLGDIRHLGLLSSFHAATQLAKASPGMNVGQLRAQIARVQRQEKELLIDPAFFAALIGHIERISAVEVLLKRGVSENELTRYRYDVVLHVENGARGVSTREATQWREGEDSLERLEERLQRERPAALRLTGIRNRRLAGDFPARQLIESSEAPRAVEELQARLQSIALDGEDPEQLWALGERAGYEVRIGWTDGVPQCFDVEYLPAGQLQERASTAQPDLASRVRQPWESYASDPVAATLTQGLEAKLREQLKKAVPEYMVPSVIVALDALPLTPNGKVDRKALPAPEGRPDIGAYVAPCTSTEEELVAIWRELLHLNEVGVEDNFFELGGHSLIATRVVARVRDVFQVELALRTLFETPTIHALASHIDELRREGVGLLLPALIKQERPARLPLSHAQERLWFLEQLGLVGAAYNVPMALQLSGSLDVSALALSIGELVRRHESLRTRFAVEDGEAAQVIDPPRSFELPLIDLRELDEAVRDEQLRNRLQAEAERTVDLERGPLLRAQLLKLADEQHVLLLTMHHIVSDGWSHGILVRELSALYEAFSSGRPSPLAELPIQYADYALWQRNWLHGEVLDSQVQYWKRQLEGAPPNLDLPTDRPRPALPSFKGAAASFAFSTDLSTHLQELARREGVTLYMVLLAAFQVLLSRWSGQKDIVVGSPIAGRRHRETEGLIGFLVNTLVMRSDLSRDPTFLDLLRQTKETTLGAYANQDVPFEKLVEELQPVRDLSRQAVFQVLFGLQNIPEADLSLPGLRLDRVGNNQVTAKFDLSLFLFETPAGLRGTFDYATDLFDRQTIDRLVTHFETLLKEIVAHPDRATMALVLLSEAERHLVLVERNDTQKNYPHDFCVHELVAQQATRTPDAIAVVFEGQQLSYLELERRSNRLARYLQSVGVGPDVIVGLCIERSVEMLIGLLGILKAGGAYLPLDPSLPSARLSFMCQDARAAAVLTQGALAQVQHQGLTVRLDTAWPGMEKFSTESLSRGTTSQHLAYVLYTSGSSGTPKAVAVAHASLCNQLSWVTERFALTSNDVVLQKTPLAFDASVWEVFAPLLCGARLVLACPDGHKDPNYMCRITAEAGVTVLQLVPSALQLLVADPVFSKCDSLKQLFSGGEPLTTELRDQVLRKVDVSLHNLYGPTETCVQAVAFSCVRQDATGRPSVPIGTAAWNTQLYVLDEHLEPVPMGVTGELYIGGVGLARGYLHRPGLTAQSYIAHPFAAGERVYRTGDLVRCRADGNLEFIGRCDAQVKLRGYRIELGEVEAALLMHQTVRQAVAVVREDTPGDQRLVGYVVSEDPQFDTGALRAQLKERLPEYMVPAAIVVLATLPLTGSGKTDRRALPAPESSSAADNYVAPRTPTEVTLAGIWREVLRMEQIGVEDNFFDLGGHSLIATRVVARVRGMFGVELALRKMFEKPTIAGIALHIEQLRRARGGFALPPLTRQDRPRRLPLSHAQERLWFLEQLGLVGSAYNIATVLRVAGALNQTALTLSVAELIRRHESLRTRFTIDDGETVQVIDPPGPFDLQPVDLTELHGATRDEQLRDRLRAEVQRPFELSRGPLLRVLLLKLANEEHVLVLTIHHIIWDGWSKGVLVREINALYGAFAHGSLSPLRELPIQFADYTLWQRSWLQGELLDRQVQYWKRQLEGAPPSLELPTDRSRPATPSFSGGEVTFALSGDLSKGLQATALRSGATMYMVLLAAFQVLLSRWSGQKDIVVGSLIAGRTHQELEGLIGLFVNTLMMRSNLSGDPTFEAQLAQVKETTLGAYAHQDLPFERLVEELRPPRDLSRQPVFQVIFTFQNVPRESWEIPGLTMQPAASEHMTSRFDLGLSMSETASGLCGAFEYATDLFDRATIEGLVRHFETLLQGIVAHPQLRVSALPLPAEAGRRRVLDDCSSARSRDGEQRPRECKANFASRVAARTPTEEMLVAIWRQVLQLNEIGIQDDFFELGGHSLAATRILTQLCDGLGLAIPLRILFEKKTIEELGEYIDRRVRP